MNTYSKRSIQVFFAVVILLSAVVEALICMGGSENLYLLLMWLPAVSALAANVIRLRESGASLSLKNLLAWGNFHRCGLRYILLGCLFPLVYLLVPYMVYWTLHPENYAYHGVPLGLVLSDCLPVLVLGTLFSLLSALGEEIGWRGFLVPALYEHLGLNKMLLLSGLFWCCWHLPLLVAGGYMDGTPLWYQLPAFVLCILPVGILAGLLAVRSNSLWPAAFLHAAHNNFDQGVFGLLTRGADKMYYVSETGVLTILCAWALAAAYYLWIKRQAARTEKAM